MPASLLRHVLLLLVLASLALTGEPAPADPAAVLATCRQSLSDGRAVLIGKRNPDKASVLSCHKWKDISQIVDLTFTAIDQEGFGVRIGNLIIGNAARKESPAADFAWHQGPLREALVSAKAANTTVLATAIAAAEQAATLAAAAPAALPEGSLSGWPDACWQRWRAALAGGDAAGAARWGAEFASAMALAADLHRWQDGLLTNHLANLDFMRLNEDHFATPRNGYNPDSHIGRFPGGHLTLYWHGNYLEVERLCERLHADPAPENAAGDSGAGGSAIALPPRVRATFLALRSKLKVANQAMLDQAAAAPWHRAWLTSTIDRAQIASYNTALIEVMGRYEARNPKGGLNGLLDVLHNRGDAFAGMDWADRFRPELMDPMAKVGGGVQNALKAAHALCQAHFKTYKGFIFTMGQSLASGQMDCIRATDIIAAAYRNAGYGGYFSIRMSRMVNGHTIAGAEVAPGKVITADGLLKGFAGTEWHQAADAQSVSIELYARGLSHYAFVSGLVLSGANSKKSLTTPVPWLPGWEGKAEAKGKPKKR